MTEPLRLYELIFKSLLFFIMSYHSPRIKCNTDGNNQVFVIPLLRKSIALNQKMYYTIITHFFCKQTDITYQEWEIIAYKTTHQKSIPANEPSSNNKTIQNSNADESIFKLVRCLTTPIFTFFIVSKLFHPNWMKRIYIFSRSKCCNVT